MAKSFDPDDSLVGKPGKPMKSRKFPWRLWFFALLMTGAAGGAGYFGWQYRQQSMDATDKNKACQTELSSLKGSADAAGKSCADDRAKLDAISKKAGDLEKQNNELAKNINATKEELVELRKAKAEMDRRVAAIEEIRKQFAKMIDTGKLKVTARHGSLVLSLPAEVLFPSGSADLSKEGELSVLEVGIILKTLTDRRFMVIGHTDNQPLAKPKDATACTYKDNWELSAERALTVTRFLVQAGMKPESIIPAGAGEHD